MKKQILFFFLCFSLGTFAQTIEPADSMTKKLGEVVVTSPTAIRKADREIYAVSDFLKEHSSTAIDLIRNLQIPQLSVNTVMETLASSLGEVQVRINGREASVDKLKAIDRNNIQRIEWIDNPGLRYGTSAGAVLNIVTTNPTTGGSLSISDSQGLTVGFNNGSTHLALNNGSSQWTIGGWLTYRGNLSMFREYNDFYRLPDGGEVQRTQKPLPGTFDLRYITPMISYNYVKPDTTNFYVGIYGNNGFNDTKFNGILSDSRTDNHITEQLKLSEGLRNSSLMPSLEIYFEHKPAKSQTLVFNAATSFGKFKNKRSYEEFGLDSAFDNIDIKNRIVTNTFTYSLEGNYIGNLGKSMLTAGLKYYGSSSRTVYRSYNNQTLRQTTDNIYFFTEYSLPIETLTLTAGVGGTWNSTTTHHVASTSSLDFTPRFSVNWRACDKSRWKISYSNYVISPSSSSTSPVTQAIDGIRIERGNPDIHSYLRHQFRLDYSYSNNSNFTLSLSQRFNHSSNPIQSYYTHEGDYILRSYSNDGYYNNLQTNLSLSWEIINEWLSFSADIDYRRQWNRGNGFGHTVNSVGQIVGLTATHWNFVLDFQFYNPVSELAGETVTKGEKYNTLSLSYSWKHWTFEAAMFMPFGRYSQRTEVIADLVKQKTVIRSKKAERMPLLTVSYNLNWGKQKRTAHRKISGSTNATGTDAAGR